MDTEDGKANPAEPASETVDPALLQSMYDVCMKGMFKMVAEEMKPRFTEMGTPCSRVWKDAWIAEVNAVEAGLKRRICGARTMAGTPCTLGSTHASGHAGRWGRGMVVGRGVGVLDSRLRGNDPGAAWGNRSLWSALIRLWGICEEIQCMDFVGPVCNRTVC